MTNKSKSLSINKIKPLPLKLHRFVNRYRILIIAVLLFILTLFYEKYAISVLLLVILLFYEEFTKREYVIRPFEVPEVLAEKGFTGCVIVNQIIDKIYEIKREAITSKELEQFGTEESEALPEIVVPGVGISLKPILRYFKAKFSPYKPISITGELLMENNLIYLTTRIKGKPPNTFDPVEIDNLMMEKDSNNIKNFEYLMLQTAIHIYKYTQPYILASYYYSLNKNDNTMEILKEIIRDKNNANKAWAYNLWGVMLNDQKKYDEAIKMYNFALLEDSKFVHAYLNLGNVCCDKGDNRAAKEYYKKAIDLDPENSNAYNGLGLVSYDKGDNRASKEHYKKAIDLDPENSHAHNGLGNVSYNEGDNGAAKERYKKAIDLDPKNSHAHYGLGLVSYDEGDNGAAKEHYKKAIDLDPESSNAYFNLAQTYNEEGDYRKAKAMYEKVVEIDPEGHGKEAREEIEKLPE